MNDERVREVRVLESADSLYIMIKEGEQTVRIERNAIRHIVLANRFPRRKAGISLEVDDQTFNGFILYADSSGLYIKSGDPSFNPKIDIYNYIFVPKSQMEAIRLDRKKTNTTVAVLAVVGAIVGGVIGHDVGSDDWWGDGSETGIALVGAVVGAGLGALFGTVIVSGQKIDTDLKIHGKAERYQDQLGLLTRHALFKTNPCLSSPVTENRR
jgi:hypothetical protein